MKPITIETIIRHLKGIVAALEKEKPMIVPDNLRGRVKLDNTK